MYEAYGAKGRKKRGKPTSEKREKEKTGGRNQGTAELSVCEDPPPDVCKTRIRLVGESRRERTDCLPVIVGSLLATLLFYFSVVARPLQL